MVNVVMITKNSLSAEEENNRQMFLGKMGIKELNKPVTSKRRSRHGKRKNLNKKKNPGEGKIVKQLKE